AFQILDYHPALVITYDGFNDAGEVDYFGRQRSDYAAGIPEEFEALADLVEEHGSPPGPRAATAVSAFLFPELKKRIDKRLGRGSRAASVESATLPESAVQAGVARYLSALTRMHDMTKARGARFIAVFQPVAELHRHLAPEHQLETPETLDAIDRFHRAVLAQDAHEFEFHDLADVFDRYFAI